MNKLFYRIIFFILAPIYAPLALFSHLTYGWWLGLKKGNFYQKFLFYILSIIYGPIAFFLWLSYGWWTGFFTGKW